MTEELFVKEQGALISGIGCTEQIFTVKQMREEKQNKLLQQAFVRINGDTV